MNVFCNEHKHNNTVILHLHSPDGATVLRDLRTGGTVACRRGSGRPKVRIKEKRRVGRGRMEKGENGMESRDGKGLPPVPLLAGRPDLWPLCPASRHQLRRDRYDESKVSIK